MREYIGLLALFCVVISTTPTTAQVINGEGTYEGSSLHQPPEPEPDSPRGKDGDKPHDASGASRADAPKRSD